MRKDPTEFRQRFQDWKSGKKVYDKGKPVYDDGKASARSAIDMAIDQLKLDEGFRYIPYKDAVGVLTSGYGFTGKDDIKFWTRASAEQRLRQLVTDLDATARKKEWAQSYLDSTPAMQAEILNLMYQGGANVIDRKMPKFREAYMAKDWVKAGSELDFGMKQTTTRSTRRRNRFLMAIPKNQKPTLSPVPNSITPFTPSPEPLGPVVVEPQTFVRQPHAAIKPRTSTTTGNRSMTRSMLEEQLQKYNPGMFIPSRPTKYNTGKDGFWDTLDELADEYEGKATALSMLGSGAAIGMGATGIGAPAAATTFAIANVPATLIDLYQTGRDWYKQYTNGNNLQSALLNTGEAAFDLAGYKILGKAARTLKEAKMATQTAKNEAKAATKRANQVRKGVMQNTKIDAMGKPTVKTHKQREVLWKANADAYHAQYVYRQAADKLRDEAFNFNAAKYVTLQWPNWTIDGYRQLVKSKDKE